MALGQWKYTKLEIPVVLVLLILALVSCSLTKKIDRTNYHLHTTPPNGIKINDNFFCDQTEISNINWLEYVYWTKKVFGSNSKEYKATLPDTTVWLQKDSCLSEYVESYLRHPAYRNYPVIGISQLQVIGFSNWRSDRVFKYLLTKHGVLNLDSTQNAEMHFTIERYFNGTYKDIKPDTNFKYYPRFRLPTLQERQQILLYADSLNNEYFDKCKTKYCRECKANSFDLQADIIPCVNDTFKIDATRNVLGGCVSKKGLPIYNLKGNVCEWTSENGICVGGGWADSKEKILKTDTFRLENQNTWTGFRNVCEWKK